MFKSQRFSLKANLYQILFEGGTIREQLLTEKPYLNCVLKISLIIINF